MIWAKTMTIATPTTIVTVALANGEVDKLLLGEQEYQYRSKYSPATGNTDLTELLAVFYDGLETQTRDNAKGALIKALNDLCGTYEGIDAIVTCILIETLRRSDGRRTLELPVEYLAEKLQETIKMFESRLIGDKSGNGQDWKDGQLGELRRLSNNVVKYGGPSFFK
jgi:hypothetical protein